MAGLMDKIHKMWGAPEDEYEYEDYPEEEAQPEESNVRQIDEPRRPASTTVGSSYSFSSFVPRERDYSDNKVVNINAKTQLQVVVCKPTAYGNEVCSIADELLRRHTVVLNLEKTEKEVARRILDFLSGVAYANNGKVKRIATGTYIITPYTVDLTGEGVLDELENNGLIV